MDRLTRRTLMRMAGLAGGAMLWPARKPALAQQHGVPQVPMRRPALSGTTDYPFGFRAYGAFRNMIMQRDFTPVVGLKTVVDEGVTDAVGAVSNLRGEISIIEGRLIVSHGAGCGAGCPPAISETAMLLATAAARIWHPPISIGKDLDSQAAEAFIREQARTVGLDEAKPFPFRLTGALIDYAMHVNAALNPAFDGRGPHTEMAMMEVSKGARIAGDVVGFYAPPSLQGVITHMGDFFHSHYVSADRTKTAHLDSFGIAAGTTLLLPRAA